MSRIHLLLIPVLALALVGCARPGGMDGEIIAGPDPIFGPGEVQTDTGAQGDVESVDPSEPGEPGEIVDPGEIEEPDPGEGPTAGGGMVHREPVLRAGETVQINLDGLPPMEPNNFIDDIAADGTVLLAYLDKVKLAGMTIPQAEEHLRDLYVDGKIYRNVVVRVFVTSRFVYVNGEIMRPARYPWSVDLTVASMIELAGDFTEFASRKVRLVRQGGTEEQVVDVDAIREGRQPDVQLLPGDRINVRRRAW